MNNKRILIVIILIIILIASVWYFIDKKESKEIGKYFDEEDNLLGDCKKWEEYDSGNSGPGVTHEEFYNKEGNLIGNCWRYHGPGSSGGIGIGCDSDELLGEPTKEGPRRGTKSPKYSCVNRLYD